MADSSGVNLPPVASESNLREAAQLPLDAQQRHRPDQASRDWPPVAAQSPTAASLPPRSEFRVRTNGVFSLGPMLAAASRASKIMLAWSLTVVAAQTVATTCVLALTPIQPNDAPFRTFLVAYMLRALIAAPFQVVRRLRPRRLLQPSDSASAEQDPEAASSGAELAPASHATNTEAEERLPAGPHVAAQVGPAAQGGPTQPVAAARPQPIEWSNETHDRFARARSVVDLTGTVVFVWGNYLLLQSPLGVSPPVWNLTLAWVILGYVVVMIPVVLLAGSVIFCLPCALVAMRLMRVGEFAGTGADENEIKKIPVVKYRRRPPAPVMGTSQWGSATNLINVPPPRPNGKWLRKFAWSFGRKKWSRGPRTGEEDEVNVLTLPDEDALCVICLAEYEDGEELRKLHCGHHFHTACTDEWLRLNRTCPLCKRDIRVPPGANAAGVEGEPAAAVGSAPPQQLPS